MNTTDHAMTIRQEIQLAISRSDDTAREISFISHVMRTYLLECAKAKREADFNQLAAWADEINKLADKF